MDRYFARSLSLVLLVLLAGCQTTQDDPAIPRDVLCGMVTCAPHPRNTP